MQRNGILSIALLLLAGCGSAGTPSADDDAGTTGEEGTETGDLSTSGGPSGTAPSSTTTDTTSSSSSSETTDSSSSSGESTDTDGPIGDQPFCAVVRGPLKGDDFTAVTLFDDSFTPTPLLPTSGELFPSPDGKKFAHVEDGGLWVFDIEAGTHTRVSEGTTVQDMPLVMSWAPTGEALLYKVADPGGGDDESIYVVRPDGSDHVELTTRGVSFRAIFGHGNVAATLERPAEGGPTVRVKLVDMDAASPAAVEADVLPGVDECVVTRPIAPCGDGILAEAGDCTTRNIHQVHGDGTATPVTDDGLGGVPVGCAPVAGRAVFSRDLELWAGPLDGSASPADISGPGGYSGSDAEVVEVEGKDGGAAVYFDSMTLEPSVADIVQDGAQAAALVSEGRDIEIPPVVGAVIAVFTYATTGTTAYIGSLLDGEVQAVYQTQDNERILEPTVVPPSSGELTELENAALFLMTAAGGTGFELKGFTGDGMPLGTDGVVRSGEDPFTIFNCVGSAGLLLCLTENQVEQTVGLLVLKLAEYLDGLPEGLEEEQISQAQPFGFSILDCGNN